FDMNIRRPLAISVGDDLVPQPHDGTVIFVKPAAGCSLFHGLGLSFTGELAENVGHIFIQLSSASVSQAGGRIGKLDYGAAQTYGGADVAARKCSLNVRHAIEIARVICQNLDCGAVTFHRHPVVLFEVINVEIPEEFDIDERSITVFDVGALVELGQRFSDFDFRYLVFLNQDTFKIGRNALA